MVINYLQFENIKAYIISREISKILWEEIATWNYFNKNSIGNQFIRAVDSIGANIAEGFGRFHKKDKIKFYYNARGSNYESMHWLELCYERKLISDDLYKLIFAKLKSLPFEINHLIKITNEKLTI